MMVGLGLEGRLDVVWQHCPLLPAAIRHGWTPHRGQRSQGRQRDPERRGFSTHSPRETLHVCETCVEATQWVVTVGAWWRQDTASCVVAAPRVEPSTVLPWSPMRSNSENGRGHRRPLLLGQRRQEDGCRSPRHPVRYDVVLSVAIREALQRRPPAARTTNNFMRELHFGIMQRLLLPEGLTFSAELS